MAYGNDSQTVLLIHSHNVNGATAFADSSIAGNGGNRHTVTVSGAVTHSTAQKKVELGQSSMIASNATSYLQIADHDDFHFGASNFTIDLWFYATALTGSNLSLLNQFVDANNYFSIELTLTALNVFAKSGGANVFGVANLTTTGLVINTWYHVALVRNGGNIYLYLNGVLKHTSTITNWPNYAAPLRICKYSTYNSFVGYWTELRVSNGVARTDFPPTFPYAAQWHDVIHTNTDTTLCTPKLDLNSSFLNSVQSTGNITVTNANSSAIVATSASTPLCSDTSARTSGLQGQTNAIATPFVQTNAIPNWLNGSLIPASSSILLGEVITSVASGVNITTPLAFFTDVNASGLVALPFSDSTATAGDAVPSMSLGTVVTPAQVTSSAARTSHAIGYPRAFSQMSCAVSLNHASTALADNLGNIANQDAVPSELITSQNESTHATNSTVSASSVAVITTSTAVAPNHNTRSQLNRTVLTTSNCRPRLEHTSVSGAQPTVARYTTKEVITTLQKGIATGAADFLPGPVTALLVNGQTDDETVISYIEVEPTFIAIIQENSGTATHVDVPPQTIGGFLTEIEAIAGQCHNYHDRCAKLVNSCDLKRYFNLAEEVPDSFLNIQIHHACLQLYKDTGIPEKTYPINQIYEWQEAQRYLAFAYALPHLHTFTMQGAARAQGLATQLNAVFLNSTEIDARVIELKKRYRELVDILRWPRPELVNPYNNPLQWIAI